MNYIAIIDSEFPVKQRNLAGFDIGNMAYDNLHSWTVINGLSAEIADISGDEWQHTGGEK